MRYFMRWLPFAVVFWIARRKLERFGPAIDGPSGGITFTMPFRGEFIGFLDRDAAFRSEGDDQ